MRIENPRRGGAAGAVELVNQQQDNIVPPSKFQARAENATHNLRLAPTCELGNANSSLAAVILYCKEAAELAATILPVTAAVFGDRWLYLVRGTALTESFADPASGETIVEIRDATAEFANVEASTIELGELLKTVGQLAAHTLGRRYCEGIIDGDVESLIQSLDHVADARVVERIVVWLDYPAAGA